MNQRFTAIILAVSLAVSTGCSGKEWRDTFDVDKANLGPSGNNPYFILTPGFLRVYAAEGSSGDSLISTVLDETFLVDGIFTRVILDSEWVNGDLEEVTRDYFAIDTTNGDVYYFGEDVNIYQEDTVVSHEGAWLTGENGARYGLMMPGAGRLVVGDKFYQEIAPEAAMDRAELISVTDTIVTPLLTYTQCAHFEESSSLESGTSDKWYAADIGIVKDDDLVLVRIVNP